MISDIHIGLVFCAALLAYGIIGGVIEYAVISHNERKRKGK